MRTHPVASWLYSGAHNFWMQRMPGFVIKSKCPQFLD
jgi:hypothetical protein